MTKQIKFIDADGISLEIEDWPGGVGGARITLREPDTEAVIFDADRYDLQEIIAMLSAKLGAEES